MDRLRSAALAVAVIALGACGSEAHDAPEGDERGAVLRVMENARNALLDGDGEGACGLLTEHARRRVLEFQVDFLPAGTPVPTRRRGVPQTCADMARAQWRLEQRDRSWSRDLTAAEFEVSELAGEDARVRLKVPGEFGPEVGFSVVKTADGWRIDDSDGVPSGY
jgi:hypothetical protein